MELDYNRMWFLGLNPAVRITLEELLLILNLEDIKDLPELNEGTEIFAERRTDGKLVKTPINKRRAEKHLANVEESKQRDEEGYNNLTWRDYIWRKKKKIIRSKLLTNNFISKQEEDLLFGLPLWIVKDQEKRRCWTKKISEDLEERLTLLDKKGGVWKPGPKDTSRSNTLNLKIKAEPMEKHNDVIILEDDLEPPTQKNGGTKGFLINEKQINPAATNQTAEGFLKNFNSKGLPEEENPKEKATELMKPKWEGIPTKTKTRTIAAMSWKKDEDKKTQHDATGDDSSDDEDYAHKLRLLHRRLDDILEEEVEIRSEIRKLRESKRR
jgi:hypothetical protein